MPNTYYITTAIPFVNGNPHIGHALEFVQADTLVRQLRRQGHKVLFQSGTDDNAFKNVLAARQVGSDPYDFINAKADVFKKLQNDLAVEPDLFVQTSSESHKNGVKHFWNSLNAKDLYQKEYSGLYCNGCEDFVSSDSLLVEGCCPEHPVGSITTVSEQNWFFRLSAYQDRLERLIKNDKLIIRPESRKNEVLGFIRGGLEDICISRNAARAPGWGTGVPGDASQTVYVWIDALVNYISGPGFGSSDNWLDWWCDDVHKIHVIGKNVWKFHAIYWPALLLSAGLPLPDELRIHGFITNNGSKISKSLGNGIDPAGLIEQYGAKAVRFYLLDQIPTFKDGDFNSERLEHIYAKKLAGGFGNILNRLLVLTQKLYIPIPNCSSRPASKAAQVAEVVQFTEAFEKQLAVLFDRLTGINQRLADEKPWSVNAENAEECISESLVQLVGLLRRLDLYVPGIYTESLDIIKAYASGRGIGKLFPAIVKAAI